MTLRNSVGKLQPGIWSSDEYIRAWAIKEGLDQGECIVPLQSLHDYWVAKIFFNKPGHPVERQLKSESMKKPADVPASSDLCLAEED